ncbi:hypothetical protein [Methylovorus mays]|uniref:hypothetical protein n=1 Tax=Methylovorus mays TaxID=184077 RepID=UPI001E6071E0|nr:hypothetical protein [Methylovorus mays]MCB5206349.1 hypothetical protein [Methylovorus mays]
MQGFYNRGEIDPPEWASKLKNYYWYIRVEGRDKAKRRRYYRLIEKEKLYLAEQLINQEQILAVCRYLAKLDKASGERLLKIINSKNFQMKLDL